MGKNKKQKNNHTKTAKRRQAKEHKRKQMIQQKHHQNASAAPKKMSMKDIKHNLVEIPKLIFEPEMQAYQFDEKMIKEAQIKTDVIPEQIQAVYTSQLNEQLQEIMDAMSQRFTIEQNRNKQMMVQSIQYYMQNNTNPCMNPVVIALYLQQLQILQNEPLFTTDNIIEAVDSYEEQWKTFLLENNDLDQENLITNVDDQETKVIEVPFQEPLQKFAAYLQQQEQDDIEDHIDNVQVFLEDYLADSKQIINLDQITADNFEDFQTTWFVQNMNPMAEDLEKMRESLILFQNYMQSI